MNLDLISMAGISISAVLVVMAIADILGTTRSAKIRAGALLGLWFGVVLAIGATQLIVGRNPLQTAGLGILVLLPVIVLSLVTFPSQAWRARVVHVSLQHLVAVQSLRVLGIIFVLLYAAHRLPAPFAPTAGWGDTLVGLFAIPLSLLIAEGKMPRLALAGWTIFGMTDLVTAVALGTLSAPSSFQVFRNGPSSAIMPTLPWILIPGFMVPCYFFLHLVSIAKMRSEATNQSTTHRSSAFRPGLV